MRPLSPLFIPAIGLLLLTGCITITESTPAAVVPSQPGTQAVATEPAPEPVTPEALAKGFVETLARGDVEQARGYCLAPDEYDIIFAWSGPADPRAEMTARMDAALQRAAASLSGAQFQRVVGIKPARTINEGRSLAAFTFTKSVQAIDNVTALVDVNGQQKSFQIDGLLQVDDEWRIFSPTFALR